MTRDRRSAGFTLIEAVVVVAVIGILTAVISSFYVQSMASYRSGVTAQMVQSDLRHAMNYMVRELRGATSIFWYDTAPYRLEYVQVGGDPENPRFFQMSGNTIQRYDGQPLCQYVESLDFLVDENWVVITITSVSSLTGGTPVAGLPFILRTSVVSRNFSR